MCPGAVVTRNARRQKQKNRTFCFTKLDWIFHEEDIVITVLRKLVLTNTRARASEISYYSRDWTTSSLSLLPANTTKNTRSANENFYDFLYFFFFCVLFFYKTITFRHLVGFNWIRYTRGPNVLIWYFVGTLSLCFYNSMSI